ncbi:MAG TPA: type VI secretion system tube protein TssD [Terracidiphilus sp.]|jgi:type VI secretion system secreted protein Hcp|nr:type VI secretion system tube protein TssD [Terracidiphilus sp.]
MALNAYLTLKGQKQGAINGPVTQKGRENSILVHAFSNEIDSPRDPATGLPTGKRLHKPIRILKEVDKTSPQLWMALVNNENLTAWELKFWSVTATGVEQQTYTIDLTNASIASIREYMENNEESAKASLPLLEEVTFTYQKIQWTWTQGGITAMDDWSAPIS